MHSDVWAWAVPVAVSILGGGLAIAWRLGGLERSVRDMRDDVDELMRWAWPGRPRRRDRDDD